MSKQARFWDWIARRYARQPVADEAAYQEKLLRTREYFSPGCRVLEFGCGTGSTAIAHAPHVGQIHATDISANMLDIARERAAQAGLSNITFERTDLAGLAGENAAWDVILGMSVLHLLPDMTGDIARINALLKPGGVFVSSTPVIADMDTHFRFIAPLFRWLPFLPSVALFSRQDLLASLRGAGFAVESSWQPDPNSAVFVVARKPV